MQKKITGLTIILSTFNRSADLRETLEAFCALERDGLDVEFVVIDNNSSDDTPEVIDAFLDRLPLRHLEESRPGKNCALNHALDTVTLKEIVVFTDDDVTPAKDWLHQIEFSCESWPEYAVFGGKILIHWPHENDPPTWCSAKWLQPVAFVLHDLGDTEHPYSLGSHPFGPNFWVRSNIFSDNYRYNENLGPRPTNRLMGSETSFLIGLSRRGHSSIYAPKALVYHRVQSSDINRRSVLRRAYRFGRSKPHLERLKSAEAVKVNVLVQVIQIIHAIASLVFSYLPGDAAKRFSSRYGALVRMGSAIESLRLAKADAARSSVSKTSDPNQNEKKH